MTPKEKAEELFAKYAFLTISDMSDENFNQTKQCALVAVDEVLNNFGLTANGQTFFTEHRAVQYYQEVKQEIENL